MNRQSKAGLASAASLSEMQRKERAMKGAAARWAVDDSVPKAICGSLDSPLKIFDIEIPCYVLGDERRVLTLGGVTTALGMAKGGSMKKGMNRLELFISRTRINPFINKELEQRIVSPIKFKIGGSTAYGYDAELLVDLCEVILQARAAGVLQKQQEKIAYSCEILMRGLARVGIVALVDEATGYQEVRSRNALHKILEAYISKELLPWTKRFPDEFYKEMFRLNNWEYNEDSVKRPQVVGKFTNMFVYDLLPDGVLNELKNANPIQEKTGRRGSKHHQFLTPEIGNPHLEKQILSTVMIMKVSDDWQSFKRLFKKAFPKIGEQIDIF